MTLLFAGHGSPMNALEENIFTKNFSEIAKTFPKPKHILAISAHSESSGIFVTATEKPETIYDFGGFPEALYRVKYNAN